MTAKYQPVDIIPPVPDDNNIPDGTTCQEAHPFSRERYIPCGEPATAIVYHDRDRRSYYMCPACTFHNVRNRGGELRYGR